MACTLAHIDDVARLAQKLEHISCNPFGIVCLYLDECQYCERFMRQCWTSFVSGMFARNIFVAQIECSDQRAPAKQMLVDAGAFGTFPAVCICANGIVRPLIEKDISQLSESALQKYVAHTLGNMSEDLRDVEEEHDWDILNLPTTTVGVLDQQQADGVGALLELPASNDCGCNDGESGDPYMTSDGIVNYVLVKDGLRLAVTEDLLPRVVMKRCHGEGRARTCVVLYFAAWCGHCISFIPRFSACVERLSGASDIGFYAVDCAGEEGAAIAREQHVTGFPTVRLYDAATGAATSYRGERTTEDLLKFVLAHSALAKPSEGSDSVTRRLFRAAYGKTGRPSDEDLQEHEKVTEEYRILSNKVEKALRQRNDFEHDGSMFKAKFKMLDDARYTFELTFPSKTEIKGEINPSPKKPPKDAGHEALHQWLVEKDRIIGVARQQIMRFVKNARTTYIEDEIESG